MDPCGTPEGTYLQSEANSPAYKALLSLPECSDYANEVNSGSLSINYDVFCVLSKPVKS